MKKIIIISSILFFIIFIVIFYLIVRKPTYKNYQKINFEYEESYNFIDSTDSNESKIVLIQNYSQYKDIVNEYNLDNNLDSSIYLKEDNFNLNNYLLVFDNNDCSSEEEISNIKYSGTNNELIIDSLYHKKCGFCMKHYDVYLYKIDKINNSNIKIKNYYHKGNVDNCDPDVAYKPIIYLYPEKDMNVSVKLEKYNNIITSYPKYDDGWNVYAKNNGKLLYNNREYYALYWDEFNDNNVNFKEGFYVKKENAIKFLEEKLDIIGFNNREANEFIMYWLPVLENNNQSLIYFELTEERESNNKLIINPKPDSMLRVNMHVLKINHKVDIKEQELTTFKRYGFTVVEWGGVIHKEDVYAR